MIDDQTLLNDWHPVMLSKDLAEGQPHKTRLLGEDLVLWRANGQVMAWQDLCVHRGARLSRGMVRDKYLTCPYHGWVYDHQGHCTRIPAHPDQKPPTKARTKTYLTKEGYDFIWVSLGKPQNDIPPFPEVDDDGFRTLAIGPFGPIRASGPRVIENFLDIAHLPWVHAGSLGDPAFPEIEDYEVEKSVEGLTARNVGIYEPDPYGTGEGEFIVYTYHVYRPLTAYLAKHSGESIGFSLLFTVTPHEVISSSAWFGIALNNQFDLDDDEFIAFTTKIIEEDIPVVESQRPELLPLDLQAELHLRSDRTAIAYRKWLEELGLSFGTE